jgi:hypothetical protein
MNSERKTQTSQENGRKSRGPITPEGKRNSIRTPSRHGLLARNLLLDRESAARFHQVVAGLHDEFQPETPAEIGAVESMAWSRWRQMRLWTLEQAALNAEIQKARPSLPDAAAATAAAHAFIALGDRSNTLNLFNRCETSYDRQFTRAFRRFLAIRDARTNELRKRTHQSHENKAPAQDSDPTVEPG